MAMSMKRMLPDQSFMNDSKISNNLQKMRKNEEEPLRYKQEKLLDQLRQDRLVE
jgi:hypothetical protein